MRVVFGKEIRDLYFSTLKNKAKLSWREIAIYLDVNLRMLTSWRLGEVTIPKNVLDKIENLYLVKIPQDAKFLSDYWHIKEAARKGAFVRNQKYGNLGTPEGRRKGGLNSLKTHRLLKTNFKVLKEIKLPRKSKELAELIGIILGDGYVSKYQVSVTLNSVADKEYVEYVYFLIGKLFPGATLSRLNRQDENTITLKVNSRVACDYLKNMCYTRNKKVLPSWILSKPAFIKACIRGFFDTEGSISFKIYKAKNKISVYKQLNFRNFNDEFNRFITDWLIFFGFSPTNTLKGSLYISNDRDIERFRLEIGMSNPKLVKRSLINDWKSYSQFLEELSNGGSPVLKTGA